MNARALGFPRGPSYGVRRQKPPPPEATSLVRSNREENRVPLRPPLRQRTRISGRTKALTHKHGYQQSSPHIVGCCSKLLTKNTKYGLRR